MQFNKIVSVKPEMLKTHPKNPRTIHETDYARLKDSLRDFPEMAENARPLIANAAGEIIAGNMKLRAMVELGWSEIPVIYVDWSEEKQLEFMIKDNTHAGRWDWDILANEWDETLLDDWGLDLHMKPGELDLDQFFEQNENPKEQKNKIVLEYTKDEYDIVSAAFGKFKESKEQVVYRLLT